jgi:putative membrane protein
MSVHRNALLPVALGVILLTIFALTLPFAPAGQLNWLLEVGPGIIGMVILAATYRRFPMSSIVYVAVFLHILILVYGGYYTYAKTPLGDWAQVTFGLSRNHYDRVGHLALGFFPALIIREVLLRKTPLRPGGWLNFIIVSIALAIGAFWELIEWWAALILDPGAGDKFLGSQGDIWDAQWDMLLAMVGAMAALLMLSGAHDRSMRAAALIIPAPRTS